VPCSVETQCYCFSQASQAEFYKPGRILQAQTSALAGGRGAEQNQIPEFPHAYFGKRKILLQKVKIVAKPLILQKNV
jgi:hypothetical protein